MRLMPKSARGKWQRSIFIEKTCILLVNAPITVSYSLQPRLRRELPSRPPLTISLDCSTFLGNQATSSVARYVSCMTSHAGVPISEALWIAGHERSFDLSRTGDNDLTCGRGPNLGKKQRFRGLWQTNDCWHAKVPDSVAYNEVQARCGLWHRSQAVTPTSGALSRNAACG